MLGWLEQVNESINGVVWDRLLSFYFWPLVSGLHWEPVGFSCQK